MFKLLKRASYLVSDNRNLLKKFGIVNPNILRNLS